MLVPLNSLLELLLAGALTVDSVELLLLAVDTVTPKWFELLLLEVETTPKLLCALNAAPLCDRGDAS